MTGCGRDGNSSNGEFVSFFVFFFTKKYLMEVTSVMCIVVSAQRGWFSLSVRKPGSGFPWHHGRDRWGDESLGRIQALTQHSGEQGWSSGPWESGSGIWFLSLGNSCRDETLKFCVLDSCFSAEKEVGVVYSFGLDIWWGVYSKSPGCVWTLGTCRSI